MCQEAPGPRCSSHGLKFLQAAQDNFQAAQKEDPASLAYVEAEAKLREAEYNYSCTHDGIKIAAAYAQAHPDDLEAKSRYEEYVRRRNQQVEALSETTNGRIHKIASLVTLTQKFYDTEELTSVIESVRRNNERLALARGLDTEAPDQASNTYQATLNRLEEQLAEHDNLTPEAKATLSELREQEAPASIVTLKTYAEAGRALPRSQAALRVELTKVAEIQNAPLNVVQSYYDAYRNQYKTLYSTLDKKERPDPPEAWIAGNFSQSGYQRSSSTVFAPSDEASMYALYRMRVDESAIPDYMKTSKVFASVSLDGEADGEVNSASLIFYTPKGKEVGRYSVEQQTNGRSFKSYLPEIADKLNGKTVLTQQNSSQSVWLKDQLQPYGHTNLSLLTTSEMASKHLNIPTTSLDAICQKTGVVYQGANKTLLAETTMDAFIKIKKKAKAQWVSKAARKHAPAINDMPLSSRWT